MKTRRGNGSRLYITHHAASRAPRVRQVGETCAVRSVVLVAVAAVLMVVAGRVMAQTAARVSKPAEAPAGNAENGKRVYTKDGCYECHGREAQGGGYNGPRLAPDPVPYSVLLSYVRNPKGEMPPYTAKVVSDQELADIYAFLQSVPHPPAAKSIPLLKNIAADAAHK